MIQVTPQMRVLAAVEPADFRKGIDGLARVCRGALRSDPFRGCVFVFCKRSRKSIKILVYDGQGFWLRQKRLSKGWFRWWAQRLKLHQTESGPKMVELKGWLNEQIEQHKVEPNSSLGEAITYMLKHWNELTLFLRQAGAPLDNNICEQALKKVILNRKNAYFYKTQNGTRAGDLFMSLIHTCELNGVNPFDYLTQLQKNVEAAALCPTDWMPWNYQEMLQRTDVTHPQTHQTS